MKNVNMNLIIFKWINILKTHFYFQAVNTEEKTHINKSS